MIYVVGDLASNVIHLILKILKLKVFLLQPVVLLPMKPVTIVMFGPFHLMKFKLIHKCKANRIPVINCQI